MATSYLEQLYQAFGKLFVRTIEGQKPNEAGDVTLTTVVKKSGSRGQLAGYETPTVTGSAVTINQSSADSTQVTGAVAVTISNGTANTSWVKTVSLTNASATISLGSSWNWVGGEVPTVSANAVLVLSWNGTFGMANLLKA